MLAFSDNQGVVSLSASQSTRNGVVDGSDTGVKNNSPSVGSATTPPVTRNAPPAPPSSFSSSSNRDLPQRCGGCRSSPSSADGSDVCVTPGVSHGHGVLMMGVQVRYASDDSRVDSLGITSTSKSVITPKPNHAGVTSKPNHPAITSPLNIHIPSNPNCAQPDEEASLMMGDDPNDSSFGNIDMSFDMDASEET